MNTRTDLFTAPDTERHTGALFSECRRWRYRLWRTWNPILAKACFVMMNPSTADEVENDATIARCVERVKKWEENGVVPWLTLRGDNGGNALMVGGVEVVNVFAWRETESKLLPKLIRDGINIVGPANDDAILKACKGAAIVICGWGQPGHQLLERGPKVLKLLRDAGVKPYTLAVNANGSPKHPLYIGYDARPVPL